MIYKKIIKCDNIEEAKRCFCNGLCYDCALSYRENNFGLECDSFCKKYPLKAAQLMGFKVIKTKKGTKVPVFKKIKIKTEEN